MGIARASHRRKYLRTAPSRYRPRASPSVDPRYAHRNAYRGGGTARRSGIASRPANESQSALGLADRLPHSRSTRPRPLGCHWSSRPNIDRRRQGTSSDRPYACTDCRSRQRQNAQTSTWSSLGRTRSTRLFRSLTRIMRPSGLSLCCSQRRAATYTL